MNNRRDKLQRGFSLVEIMVAMVVFMIAILGLIALQKVSMTSAAMGRRQTAATNLATYVLTWLQSEAAMFPVNYTNSEANPNLNDYPLLGRPLVGGETGIWQVLDSASDPTMRFDLFLGNSTESFYTTGVDSARFCVEYMIEQFAGGGVEAFVPELYQARVRVSWPKDGQMVAAQWKDCSQRSSILAADIMTYHTLEVAGVLSREFASKVR